MCYSKPGGAPGGIEVDVLVFRSAARQWPCMQPPHSVPHTTNTKRRTELKKNNIKVSGAAWLVGALHTAAKPQPVHTKATKAIETRIQQISHWQLLAKAKCQGHTVNKD